MMHDQASCAFVPGVGRLDYPTLRQYGETACQCLGEQVLLPLVHPTADIPIRRMAHHFDRQSVLRLSGGPLSGVSAVDVQSLHRGVFFHSAGYGIGARVAVLQVGRTDADRHQ